MQYNNAKINTNLNAVIMNLKGEQNQTQQKNSKQ